ncbi:electron transfer flavoprotein subunit beta/FixA family protein [Vulcanimicrobium alpinum]|uniref:electron transfer flavoprotein subunit beta/FixA family protein n=1 Tax=Vulcanimicrobium alpinum TaxID=3016050 RepID=UPI00295E69DE|nr:electron transfer flavoprotein subunit beta/FixA family protein [Vulcanimicrobium alpinum]
MRPEVCALKILVTVKLVPDTNADKRIDPVTKRLVRTGVETVLNPFDEYAIEAALQLKEKLNDGSTVTVLSMTPATGKEIVRKALAMGADDAVMVSDDAVAGSDLWGTSVVLAAAIKAQNADLVLTGTQSTDAISGDLPGMLAEKLGIPGLTYARKIEIADGRVRVQRETDNGYMTVSAALPALVSVTKSANEPRYANLKGIMGAKKKEIKALALGDLGLTAAVGTDGAKAKLTNVATPPVRGKGQVVQAADGAEGAKIIVQFLKERKFL